MSGTVGDRLAGPERDSSRLNPAMAGAFGVLGGVLWVGALLVEYRYNLFPPGQGPAYVADQLVFGAAMLCYVMAVLGLCTSGPAGRGRGARTAVAIWALGWVLVFLGLVTGLIAPDVILGEVLPAVGGLLTAIFGLMTGISGAHAQTWPLRNINRHPHHGAT